MGTGRGPGFPAGTPTITVILIIILLPLRSGVMISLLPSTLSLALLVAFLASFLGSLVVPSLVRGGAALIAHLGFPRVLAVIAFWGLFTFSGALGLCGPIAVIIITLV